MKNLFLFAVLVLLPLLLGGCGSDNNKPVAENKPIEEMPINPNLKYETEGDAVTITGRDRKASGALTIPATIEGNPVTSIGDRAFLGCTDLSAVTFLGNAPKAGEYVFLGATPTIYRNPKAKGWSDTFAGRPVKLISEKP